MTRKNRHVRFLDADEQTGLDELNVQLKQFRFEVFYYNKDGKKNARRPWRIQMAHENFRFFDTFDQLKKYADRLVFEHVEVEKMNTKLKLYSSKAHVEIRWLNNMPSYYFHKPNDDSLQPPKTFRSYGATPTRSAKKVTRRGLGYWTNRNITSSFEELIQRVQRELSERQASFIGAVDA